MFLLIFFAFIAGIVTILSPCILPILPIVLSSSTDTTGKRKPLGVVVGFVASFTLFTLFLSAIVRLSGLPPNSLRFFSIIILSLFGLSLLIPQAQTLIERAFGSLTRFAPRAKQTGFLGGLIIGLSLGILWTPCVGPILASVISLAITGTVTAQAFLITLAYATGTAIPMFIVIQTGATVLQKVPWLLRNTARIQKAFGVVMILTAISIFFNWDRTIQTYILNAFPNYGSDLIKVEDNEIVKEQLKKVNSKPIDQSTIGKPMPAQDKGILAPELILGGQWFNSEPLTLSELRGKVVIVDFWTYSCINCQRTFPYLKSWWQKYKDQGLVIIGVHSPEFEFEKNPKNVSQAIDDFGLGYPIMQDNNFATWRTYENRYWPAKYIIDKDGVVRYTHFGEGEYDKTEKIIQELLAETGTVVSSIAIENPTYQIFSRTPEIYLGYKRLQNFGSPENVAPNEEVTYTTPSKIPANVIALDGMWKITGEYAEPEANAKLSLNFESKEVFLVARPKNGIATIKVFIDDKQDFFGTDNEDGVVTVDTDGLYKLIILPEPGRHLLRLEFDSNNIELYAFTFG